MDDGKIRQIEVILCEPGRKARVTTVSNSLESLQAAAGGSIEAVYPFDDPVAIVCNEEGKRMGLPLNRALRDERERVYDIVAGTFLVAGLVEEDFASLTPLLRQKYISLFEYPEVFIRIGRGLLAVPDKGCQEM